VGSFDRPSGEAMPALNPTWSFTSQPPHIPPDIIHLESVIQHLAERRIEFKVSGDIRQIFYQMLWNSIESRD